MLQRIERGATWIGAILMPVLAVVVLYNVLARALFSRAPSWPFEVSIFIFGILALLAGGQVLRDQGHVAVDILPRRAGPRLRWVLHIISMVVIIIVCVFVVYDGSLVALESTRVRERSIFQTTFNPEIWWFRWMIPIGAAIILLEALRQLFAARRIDGVPDFDDEEIEL
ncbi:TRAP transporter small permease subunit [Ornithinimicrobium cavernae]|uniref:TRAP transporter small permease subunit n=1 Tax=Ornithinimicrobium cavernae TaxID=2666047 RepID=UPI000D685A5E|nr:TRAP transporter small permease subunit [Ornithinimicrobium cavernae]